MDHQEFTALVADAAHSRPEQAERAERVVLQTLAERIDRGEARDLAALLPPEEAVWVATATPARSFDADAFVQRVADAEGIDADEAERHVRAVFAALERAVGRQELGDVRAQLSRDYDRLLTADTGAADVIPRVAVRAGLDRAAAERATAAVLETLAERIAGGEVQDLIERLPRALHEPLRRGLARSGGRATPMSFDAFLGRVAAREGVSLFDAREHTRAVLGALREAVGDDEFFDVKVQLPPDYAPVLL
jgi:uncharacterized protein (DUF2267 family)